MRPYVQNLETVDGILEANRRVPLPDHAVCTDSQRTIPIGHNILPISRYSYLFLSLQGVNIHEVHSMADTEEVRTTNTIGRVPCFTRRRSSRRHATLFARSETFPSAERSITRTSISYFNSVCVVQVLYNDRRKFARCGEWWYTFILYCRL